MQIFVLGVPHTQTTAAFTTCPFTMKTRMLCRMMTGLGHEVIHLGVEGSQVDCTEHVSVVPESLWRETFGHPGAKHYQTKTDGPNRAYHELYARNVRRAIDERVGRDWSAIVCATWGGSQRWAVGNQGGREPLRQFVVESGIGYRETWAKFRVFVAYAWLHFHLGREGRWQGDAWYDAVIPNAIDPALFDFRPADKRDYFLYLGRLNEDKGVAIAIDVARRAGRPIKIVGQGDPSRFLEGNSHVEYVPPVGVEDRRRLLAEAAALLCPTRYVEPLGNIAIEAAMSGTPVIATDWGGFTETVLHGQTGYRCRTMDHFTWAARNVDRIDAATCRRWAEDNFAPPRIAPMFAEYFQMLLDLNADGWYAPRPHRTELDWLRKRFPRA